MPRGWATLHFEMIAGEQPVICKALKGHVDDKPSMIPLDTIDNSSTSNQVVQHLAPTQFLGTTSAHDTTCPSDSLHTNARMLGIFDNANSNLEIGWLTRGSSMRVFPTLQKTVCKQQSEITSAGLSHHRITQQRFPRMDVKGPFLWNGRISDISTTHDASNSWVSGLGPGPVSIQESLCSFLNCIHQGPSGQKMKKKNKAMAQRDLKCICFFQNSFVTATVESFSSGTCSAQKLSSTCEVSTGACKRPFKHSRTNFCWSILKTFLPTQ